MPFIRSDDTHKCQTPIWPWMYRMFTVWKCSRCGRQWRMERSDTYYDHAKKWVGL